MYLNKAFIAGNLTRDPELKSLPSGAKVANFGVATNRYWRDKSTGERKEATEFHNIVVFGAQAETVTQYLKKGSGVLIEGRIQTRSWEGQDGKKNYRTEVVADVVQFGARSAGGGNNASPAAAAQPAADQGGNQGGGDAKLDVIEYPEEDINPEDIPF